MDDLLDSITYRVAVDARAGQKVVIASIEEPELTQRILAPAGAGRGGRAGCAARGAGAAAGVAVLIGLTGRGLQKEKA